MGHKEQEVTSGVKRLIDPALVTNNLWRIDLLIMVYQMDKNIYIVRGVQLLGYSGVS